MVRNNALIQRDLLFVKYKKSCSVNLGLVFSTASNITSFQVWNLCLFIYMYILQTANFLLHIESRIWFVGEKLPPGRYIFRSNRSRILIRYFHCCFTVKSDFFIACHQLCFSKTNSHLSQENQSYLLKDGNYIITIITMLWLLWGG